MSAPRILVIEDDPSVISVVEFVLEMAGFDAVFAGDGGAGVASARQTRPAVILLDLGIPVLDGYGVCAALAEDPATAAIPIVLMTGTAESASSERLAKFPIRDVIVKPFSPKDLLARVQVLVGSGG